MRDERVETVEAVSLHSLEGGAGRVLERVTNGVADDGRFVDLGALATHHHDAVHLFRDFATLDILQDTQLPIGV